MRRRNLILFVVFLLVAIGIVVGVLVGFLPKTSQLPDLEIWIVHATEETEWLSAAARRFNQEGHRIGGQRIVVHLEAMDSGDALLNIRDEKFLHPPTAWSPSSMLWVNLLNAEWYPRHGTDLIMRVGQYQATPLVLTPMVLVMWQDRAEVFLNHFGEEPDWDTIQEALAAPEGWKTLGGQADWGYVKFGQTDPVLSNSGLVAITLATYEYFDKIRGLTVAELMDSLYRAWMQSLWRGIVGGYDRASANLMRDMILYGASKYDVIMVYENLVATQMKNAPGRWGTSLRVFYPRLNLWNDHPFCILMADWSSADQKDAALEFQKFLLREDIQKEALRYGFRPANVDVPVVNDDPENPFNLYQEQGLQVQIPRINLVEPPSAEVIRELQALFRQAQP